MAKRQGSELNHDNWDQEEEKEEPGSFVPVSDKELQNRVIKRAKRTMSTCGSDGEGGLRNLSPFSAFSGFSKSSQRTFTFQPQDVKMSKPPIIKPLEKKDAHNGCKELPSSKLSETPKEIIKFSRTNNEEQKSERPDSTKNVEYFRQLQSLNESVLKWMQLHIGKNPCCDFTPVFNDYKNHLQRLERAYPAMKKMEAKMPTLETSKSSPFKIPQTSAGSWSDSSKLSVKGAMSSKVTSSDSKSEKTSETDPEMLYGAHFASNTTNTSSFSFGMKESPTSMTSGSKSGPTTSFSSDPSKEENDEQENSTNDSAMKSNSSDAAKSSDSSVSTTMNSSAKPFNFSFSAVSSSAGNGQDSDHEKTEEYVPPKNEFKIVSEEDSLYSKRCKLFFKKGNEYVDKGVGMLHLKPLDGKTQLLIRADTSLGNILLNIMLNESLPIERMGKNNVLIVCIPHPPIDPKETESKQSIPLLIRVKTSDDADELYKKLNQYKS